MASLRIFSGRQVLSEADSCDTGLADDDELKYMILPLSPHIYTRNIFMRPSTFFTLYCWGLCYADHMYMDIFNVYSLWYKIKACNTLHDNSWGTSSLKLRLDGSILRLIVTGKRYRLSLNIVESLLIFTNLCIESLSPIFLLHSNLTCTCASLDVGIYLF